jgi:hypothetical protein
MSVSNVAFQSVTTLIVMFDIYRIHSRMTANLTFAVVLLPVRASSLYFEVLFMAIDWLTEI